MTKWITTKEAGEQLGVSQRTIQRYIKQGLLKTKTIKGKKAISDSEFETIKTGDITGAGATKERQDKRQSSDKKGDTTSDKQPEVSQSWQPPEGYILIDKGTLDTIKSQLTELTSELKQMRTTQQLLIEKGLNLNQIEATGDTTQAQNDTTATRHAEDIVADKPSDKVKTEATKQATDDTKHHDNNKKRIWGIVGLVFIGVIIILAVLLVLMKTNTIPTPDYLRNLYNEMQTI